MTALQRIRNGLEHGFAVHVAVLLSVQVAFSYHPTQDRPTLAQNELMFELCSGTELREFAIDLVTGHSREIQQKGGKAAKCPFCIISLGTLPMSQLVPDLWQVLRTERVALPVAQLLPGRAIDDSRIIRGPPHFL